MQEPLNGKVVWQFADNFNADLIVGSRYIEERDPQVLGKICLADYDPTFTQRVKQGDIVIAGRNFGYGHPHYQGMMALKMAGIATVIAESIYPVWYRMAIFYAFAPLECPGITRLAKVGDELEANIRTGAIKNLSTVEALQAEPMPPFLLEIVEAGGMIAHLRKVRCAS